MDQNYFFLNRNSLSKPSEEVLMGPEVTEWQQFSSQSKQQRKKDELLNFGILQLPPDTPGKNYNEFEDFSDERNGAKTQFSPSSAYCRAENTDFLSAIPYARSSYTVKRKLNYEDENTDFPNNVNVNNFQKTKTYFPFEFVGHATRKSTVSVETDTRESGKIVNPTMVTGQALRRPNVNGSVFQTFTTQCETPMQSSKQRGKVKLKKRSNRQVALEKHIEQIRRKHAEFKWDINEPQKKVGKFHETGFPPDTDCQRVPTSPFLERYASPSLYSSSETPLNPVSWMNVPSATTSYGAGIQNFERRTEQRYFRKDSSNNECWSDNTQEEFSGNISNETKNFHLYPY